MHDEEVIEGEPNKHENTGTDQPEQEVIQKQVNIGTVGSVEQVGDRIQGDKVGGDQYKAGDITNSHVAIGPGAQVNVHLEAPPKLVIPKQWFEPEVVLIPEGEFWMGSDQHALDERPCKQIYLPAYHIAIYPVTDEQYAAFLSDIKRFPPPELLWKGSDPPELDIECPVTGVTWYDAMEYCQWLKEKTGRLYSLPTEEQWEKAARFTDGRLFPWGPKWEAGRCNVGEIKTSVNAFDLQSVYGCFDMVGNAREWTLTNWGRDSRFPDRKFAYTSRPGRRNSPDEPITTRRVTRGGRGKETTDYRCSARGNDFPDSNGISGDRFGFRVVLLPGNK